MPYNGCLRGAAQATIVHHLIERGVSAEISFCRHCDRLYWQWKDYIVIVLYFRTHLQSCIALWVPFRALALHSRVHVECSAVLCLYQDRAVMDPQCSIVLCRV